MNQGTAAADLRNGVAVAGEAQEFVTVTVAGQLFGIPVLQVQDVLGPQRITRIPLAPPEVAGALHPRRRPAPAIALRPRPQLSRRPGAEGGMSVGGGLGGERYRHPLPPPRPRPRLPPRRRPPPP